MEQETHASKASTVLCGVVVAVLVLAGALFYYFYQRPVADEADPVATSTESGGLGAALYEETAASPADEAVPSTNPFDIQTNPFE